MNHRSGFWIGLSLLLVGALLLLFRMGAPTDQPPGEAADLRRPSSAPPDPADPDAATPSDVDRRLTHDPGPSHANPRLALGGATELTDAELDALARQLESDPNTHVVCELGIDIRHADAYLAVGDPEQFNGRRVTVVRGKAYLPLVYGRVEDPEDADAGGQGMFSVDGYGPVSVAWSDRPTEGLGRCTAPITPEPGQASLTGTLTLRGSGAPAAGGWVEGCGNLAVADQNGVVHMDILPKPCTIIAMRQDGLLRTMSEPVPIVPQPGEDVVVDIQIPEGPRGGLGIQLSIDDAGHITIDQILDTGPAGAAGLEAGDVVVEVNGESTEGMDLAEFVDEVGGEAGTSVAVTVDRDGEHVSFDIVREVLSPG